MRRRRGIVLVGPAEPSEHPEDESCGVGERQHRSDHDHREDSARADEVAVLDVAVERLLLGDEAEQRGDARHRGRADHGDDLDEAPVAAEAVEAPDVAGAGTVVDDAHHHEQCGLECRVGEQQHHACFGELVAADPEQQHHEAELADRAVGEQQLEVVLTKGAQPTDHHRDGADDQHEQPPLTGQGEDRRKAGDEVDAGLDHRGRVQIGAHRGGCDHGAREPAAERCLRRLGERPDEHEHDGGVDDRPRWRIRGEFGDAIRAPDLADHDQAGEHRQPTPARDEQCLQRGGAGTRISVVVADEQIRRDRGQFPEHEQPDQLVGQDDPEHRAGEQCEQACEAADTRLRSTGLVGREVAERVDADQQPDARDDRDHQECERVEPQIDGDVESAHPGERLGHRLAVDDAGPSGRRPHEHRGGRDRGDREGPVPERPPGSDDCDADDEMKGEQREHGGGVRPAPLVPTLGGAPSGLAERLPARLGERFQLGRVTDG